MRLYGFLFGCLAVIAMSACSEDEISSTTPPPIAAVRFINAVTDTGAVDIRMVDQVEWSAFATGINYRAGTAYQPTEAKARHIRVFPTSLSIAVTSQIMHDTTITFTAGTRVTALLTGSARAKTLKFVLISDDITPPAAGQISVRMVNASSGAVNGYLTTASTDPLPGTATFSNVGALAASPYVSRPVGNAALRSTDVGSSTVTATAAGPAAPASAPGDVFPAAGVNSSLTKFSVYYFPRGVAGSPQNAVTTPTAVWFVDRNPCDAGASC